MGGSVGLTEGWTDGGMDGWVEEGRMAWTDGQTDNREMVPHLSPNLYRQ